MKKSFILLMAVVLLLVPFSSTFAYGNNLTSGKLPISNQNTSGTLSNLTNGDSTSSGGTVSFNHVTDAYNAKVRYELTEVSTIDGVLMSVSAPAVFAVSFYDANSTLISSVNYNTLSTSTWNGTAYNITAVNNVKYVEFYTNSNGSDAGNYTAAEFAVYGSFPITYDEITNLTATDTNTGVSLAWSIPSTNTDFTGSKVYRDGSLLGTLGPTVNGYDDTTALDGSTYVYKVTATYSDGFETTGTSTTITPVAPPDTVAPAEVTNVQYTPGQTTIDVSFTNPIDSDFKQANIYRDGVFVGSSTTGTFNMTGLTLSTAYVIKITSVDMTNNESVGVSQTVSTLSDADITPPSAPTGLEVTNASNGALVKWNKNLESDIQGYNIYVDGVKENATPITSTSYQILGLEVGQTYSIKVSAVDTSNNESAQSVAVSAVPSATAMPLLEMGYELTDVADGVTNWFGSMWLIVAFSVAIPLAFYIANRTKLLFLN